MIERDEGKILPALERRPNLVRSTTRAVGVGLAVLGCYNTVYTLAMHQREQSFMARAQEVVNQSKAVLDTLRKERSLAPTLDTVVSSLRAIQAELAKPSYQDTAEVTPLPFAARDCGRAHSENRYGYRARIDACGVTVTIPRGGSISGASLVYFGDKDRWQDDWDYESNPRIENPRRVPPGTIYRFTLP